jgi:murein DD-endopeptidase MepM/ murein hydrolase activator NlpD
MSKVIIMLLLIIVGGIVFLSLLKKQSREQISAVPTPGRPEVAVNDLNNQSQSKSGQVQAMANNLSTFQPPLPRSAERVTQKPFGIFITPQKSPVSPEKFRGYHTGTDFEIFPEELNSGVPVSAVCSGKLVLKKYANGYGGVAVQNCSLDGSLTTVIYGHLKLSSISANSGNGIKTGDAIGILGKDKSAETDGERKHLHLGIHRGPSINLLGYVQKQSGLSAWIDPCLYLCDR